MTKQKILVVDDEPGVLSMLKTRLEANEYDVITAENGKEGIKMAEEHVPDLIILDILMPVMGGMEANEELHKNPKTKNIPIIFLTGTITKEDEDKLKEMSHLPNIPLISKPFKTEELIDTIRMLMITKILD